MRDLELVVDAATFVRLEKQAARMKISVEALLNLFFDRAGCPNPNFDPRRLSQPNRSEED